MAAPLTKNWVFLGDSLTEGLGSSRATYVTELAKLLRAENRARAVHDMRLRRVDPQTFNPFIKANLAGFCEEDPNRVEPALWIWNLAAEGQTIGDDLSWLPLLRNLQPERVVIYRGSLESIIRPAAVRDGSWPAWVPRSWRGFVAMDPQCYFSTTWYRRAKQVAIDGLKQRVRHRLLAEQDGRPLLDGDTLLRHYADLLAGLATLRTSVHNAGPDTAQMNTASRERRCTLPRSMRSCGRWPQQQASTSLIGRRMSRPHERQHWRYRDGFHPNMNGAQLLARVLHARLAAQPCSSSPGVTAIVTAHQRMAELLVTLDRLLACSRPRPRSSSMSMAATTRMPAWCARATRASR